MKIAITTPTGNIGHRAVERLLEIGGHDLVLLCRKPETVKDFTDKGAAVVQGDLADQDYVVRATEGADALFWLTPPRFDAEDFRRHQTRMGESAAKAIRANKIKRVVHLSSFGAQHADGTGPIAGLHRNEKLINQAAGDVGGSVTHLRPASFFENYFMALDSIKHDGAVYLPVPGDARVSMIATRDIGDAAAELLADDSWTGLRVQELLGPRDYTYDEAATIIGRAVGKEVKHVPVPPEAANDALRQMGASEDTARTFIEMYTAIPKGLITSEKPRSKASTTPTTLEDFAKTAIAPAVRGA